MPVVNGIVTNPMTLFSRQGSEQSRVPQQNNNPYLFPIFNELKIA